MKLDLSKMCRKYDCVIFDLDGTLLDTSKGILACTDYILKLYELPPLAEDEKIGFIGPLIQDSLHKHLGCTREQAWELATAWRNTYKDKFLFDAEPYDGIYDVLRFCRENGIMTGVATNKREDHTHRLLDHFQLSPFFDCIAGTDFAGKLKKADLIRECMDRTGIVNGKRCLMVGDTEGDWNAAELASVQFLGVTYGFGYSDKKSAGVICVNACTEIIDYLRE